MYGCTIKRDLFIICIIWCSQHLKNEFVEPDKISFFGLDDYIKFFFLTPVQLLKHQLPHCSALSNFLEVSCQNVLTKPNLSWQRDPSPKICGYWKSHQ